MRTAVRLVAVLVIALTLVGCRHAPPTLTPVGVTLWHANLGAHYTAKVQTWAIALNDAQVLPDAQTRLVVRAIAEGFPVLEQAPNGWKATVSRILERLAAGLDANGKTRLASVILLVDAALNAQDDAATRALPGPQPTDAEMAVVFHLTITQALADGRQWTAAHP